VKALARERSPRIVHGAGGSLAETGELPAARGKGRAGLRAGFLEDRGAPKVLGLHGVAQLLLVDLRQIGHDELQLLFADVGVNVLLYPR